MVLRSGVSFLGCLGSWERFVLLVAGVYYYKLRSILEKVNRAGERGRMKSRRMEPFVNTRNCVLLA